MSYMKDSLIVRPGRNDLGVSADLGDIWDTIKGGASSAIDFFGAGLKAQGGQEALAAQLAAQQAAAAKAAQGGVSTPVLVIGGLALVGALVFAMRRK